MAEPLSSPPTSADDLLILLAVSRSGRFAAAAKALGVAHTTVARRMQALESQLGGRLLVRGSAGWELTPLGRRAAELAGGIDDIMTQVHAGHDRLSGVIRMTATDGFSAFVAAPALVRLREKHPDVTLEIVAATRHPSPQRFGADVEVVVGKPAVDRATAVHIADYALRLYASTGFLARHGEPRDLADLGGAPFIYFIDSMLSVDALDHARSMLPDMRDAVASTNVFVHVAATRAGAGFGLLPAYLADDDAGLVRVLPEVQRVLPYWLVARKEAFDRPLIAEFLVALRERIDEVRPTLLGR